jgi:hypothetical protein
VLNYFSLAPPENSGGAENSTEKSDSHAKNFFCSMYEMSQQHPVWVAENHVKPCNSVYYIVMINSSVTVQTLKLTVVAPGSGSVPETRTVILRKSLDP